MLGVLLTAAKRIARTGIQGMFINGKVVNDNHSCTYFKGDTVVVNL